MRFDPSVRGTLLRKKPKKVAPYNTQLNTGKNTVQASCKCFGRTTQGACSGHYADLWLREAAAEQALQEACGAAFDLGARLNAAEGLLDALLKVATLVPEMDRLVCSPDGQPPLPPVRAMVQIDAQMLHCVKLALADIAIGKDHVVAEPTEEQE